MKFIHLLPSGFSFTSTITLALLCSGHSVHYEPIACAPARRDVEDPGRRISQSFVLLVLRTVVLFNPLKVFLPLGLMLFVVGLAEIHLRRVPLEPVGDGGHGLPRRDRRLVGRPARRHDRAPAAETTGRPLKAGSLVSTRCCLGRTAAGLRDRAGRAAGARSAPFAGRRGKRGPAGVVGRGGGVVPGRPRSRPPSSGSCCCATTGACPRRAWLRAHFAGLAANLCLPGVAGGDVVRAECLRRRTAMASRSRVAAVVDRALDCFALLLLAAAGMLMTGGSEMSRRMMLPVGAAGLAAALAAAVLGVLVFKARGHRSGLAGRLALAATQLAARPALPLVCLLLSLGVQTMFVFINMRFGLAVGVDVPIAGWLVAWPLAKLVALVPISLAGLGIREAALVAFLQPYGAAAAPVTAAGLLWQSVLFAGGLVGWLAGAARDGPRSGAGRRQAGGALMRTPVVILGAGPAGRRPRFSAGPPRDLRRDRHRTERERRRQCRQLRDRRPAGRLRQPPAPSVVPAGSHGGHPRPARRGPARSAAARTASGCPAAGCTFR